MNNFIFENSSKVYFGEGCVKEYLSNILSAYGDTVMLCYGGGSIKKNGIYVDGTAGGGGHSSEILSRLTTGKLISIDQDPDAILTLTERFKKNENSIIIKGNFADMVSLLHSRGVGRVDGVLLDIGVSSHQLDTAERGFSFHEDAPLDMRMSQSGTTAAELVNTLPAGELRRILSVYGEEKFAGAIVNGIVKARAEKPIETTLELAEIIKENVPYVKFYPVILDNRN